MGLFFKRLAYDATWAQRFNFKACQNLKNETTDEARVDLIPEEEWKQYYKETLVNEEETFQTETICVNEYKRNQYGGPRRCYQV
jgi:hypothetical protein